MRRFCGVLVAGGAALLIVGVSPLIALWLPDPWRRHVYHEISFQLIANRRLPSSRVPENVMRSTADYTRKHLWLLDNPTPYPGKPFDYLVEGTGWCDYAAKVFCRLLAAKGVHARYVFLKDAQGISPHTIAEVRVQGRWVAVDPFFDLIYTKDTGELAALEELTPELVEHLPELAAFRATTSEVDQDIMRLARRTFPLPWTPQRSDDFLSEKHLFDWTADLYVNLFGHRFADWYQDRFLRQQLAAIRDPDERLWQQARNYHLYGRLAQAEEAYRTLLSRGPPSHYRERTVLFLSRLLMRQKRFPEAREILDTLIAELPTARWAHFHLALCYEGLGDRANAIQHFRRYQELHGSKFSLETAKHLNQLQQAI